MPPAKPQVARVMANPGKLTESLSVKLSSPDFEMLRVEAARRGYSSLTRFARELILDSLAVPTDKTVVLETVLRFERTMVEIMKKAADGTMTVAEIESIEERSEMLGETLVARFRLRRGSLKEGGADA